MSPDADAGIEPSEHAGTPKSTMTVTNESAPIDSSLRTADPHSTSPICQRRQKRSHALLSDREILTQLAIGESVTCIDGACKRYLRLLVGLSQRSAALLVVHALDERLRQLHLLPRHRETFVLLTHLACTFGPWREFAGAVTFVAL